MKPRVMIVGLGGLGAVLLELLARDDTFGEIVVASRDEARGRARCNLARVGALAQGVRAAVRFVRLDLDAPARAAACIAREFPDLVVCTATRQTWWLSDLLPAPARSALTRAGFGAWLPVHLALAIKFMQAIRDAGFRGHTVMAPFPDVVNVVLGRLGLAPTCGLGNLDEIVPKVRLMASERLSAPVNAVRVLLVAHHALEPLVFGHSTSDRPPYWLRVECDGRDVTPDVDPEDLLFAPYPLPSGPAWHFLTAASGVRLLRALAGSSGALLHVPGPAGLPGGYPVAASTAGVRLFDLPGLSQAEAVSINERSHRFDGIERIAADGTVEFTEATVAAMRDTLGYNVRLLRPGDADSCAAELSERFGEYAARHGVNLKAARTIVS